LAAEDTSYSSLPVSGEDKGNWTLVRTTEPYRMTAVAAWVDGRPAQGGLAGRFQQARDSIFGGSYSAVLMTIGSGSNHRLSPDQQNAVLNHIRAVVEAQPGLTDQVAALSRR
ncbi:MAG TPA: hypothetical protein VE650_20055, partial [Acetobacteraceae bacterium]|nr:hypothetical protein [Acetobacteraceae bacterium]